MDDPASIILLLFQDAEPISISSVLLNFLLIFLIVGLNGFFVASEFALVSARKARIKTLADEGSGGAEAALWLLEDPTRFISAVQLGVTLASLALGWRGEPTLAAILEPVAEKIASGGTAGYIAHGAAIVIAFCAITFLHVVLGELVPKMFALERAETFALFASRPLRLFAKIFSPVLWAFNRVGGLIARGLGLHSSLAHASVYTEDEIRHLIKISQEGGQINAEEQMLINKVFEFSETTVKEAMIPRTEIVAIAATSDFNELTTAFREHGYSRLPVFRGSLDDIVGVVHSKDILQYVGRIDEFKIEDVALKPNYVVDTARLEDVLRQMQKEKFHFGFVVDEHGGVEGIITLEDLLEEIVGDISDEHDEEVNEQIAEQPDGSCILDGGLAVRDLNRRLQINLPMSESYTTIAGFLMAEAGQILIEGDTLAYNGHEFQVTRVDKRRILEVRMTHAEDSERSGQEVNK